MNITGMHHTSFTVADLDRSIEFFRDRLGFEVIYVREIRDGYFGEIVGLPGCAVKATLLRLPGCGHFVELFQYLQPRGEPCQTRPCDPGSSHLALLVQDLPAMHANLQAHGVAFVSAPVLLTGGPNQGGYGALSAIPMASSSSSFSRRESPQHHPDAPAKVAE